MAYKSLGKPTSMGAGSSVYQPKAGKSATMKEGNRPSFPEWDESLMGQAKMIASNRGYSNNPAYNQYVYKKMQLNQRMAINRHVAGNKQAMGNFYKNLGRVFDTKTYSRIYGLQDGAEMLEGKLPHKMELGDVVYNNHNGKVGILQERTSYGSDTVLVFQDRRFKVDSFDHGWSVEIQEDQMPTGTSNNPPVSASSAQTAALFKEEIDEADKVNPVLKDKAVPGTIIKGVKELKKNLMEVADDNSPITFPKRDPGQYFGVNNLSSNKTSKFKPNAPTGGPIAQTGAHGNREKLTGLMHNFNVGGKGESGPNAFHAAMTEHIQKHGITPGSRIKVEGPNKSLFHGVTTSPGKTNVKGVSGSKTFSTYENMHRGSGSNKTTMKTSHGDYKVSHVSPGQTPKEQEDTRLKTGGKQSTGGHMEHWDNMSTEHKAHLERHPGISKENKGSFEQKISDIAAFKEHIGKYGRKTPETSKTTTSGGEYEQHVKSEGIKSPAPMKDKYEHFKGVPQTNQKARSFDSAAIKSEPISPKSGERERGVDFSKNFNKLKDANADVDFYAKKTSGAQMIKVGGSSIHDLPSGFMRAKEMSKKEGWDIKNISVVARGNMAKTLSSPKNKDYNKIIGQHTEQTKTTNKIRGDMGPAFGKQFSQKRQELKERETPGITKESASSQAGVGTSASKDHPGMRTGNTRTNILTNLPFPTMNIGGVLKGAGNRIGEPTSTGSEYNKKRTKLFGKTEKIVKKKAKGTLHEEAKAYGGKTEDVL